MLPARFPWKDNVMPFLVSVALWDNFMKSALQIKFIIIIIIIIIHCANCTIQTQTCFSFSDQSVKLVPFHLYFHAYPGRRLMNAMVRLHSYPQTTRHCIRLSNPNPVLVPARPPQQIRRIHITFPTLGLRNNIVRFWDKPASVSSLTAHVSL